MTDCATSVLTRDPYIGNFEEIMTNRDKLLRITSSPVLLNHFPNYNESTETGRLNAGPLKILLTTLDDIVAKIFVMIMFQICDRW